MDQDIFKHDHALSSWLTLCISRDGVTTTVLMVETDLNLNAKDSNYRKGSIDSLVAAAVAYVGLDRIRTGDRRIIELIDDPKSGPLGDAWSAFPNDWTRSSRKLGSWRRIPAAAQDAS